ncbi:MAG: S8 family peptidase, partial [Oxalobacteraceae bacterium]
MKLRPPKLRSIPAAVALCLAGLALSAHADDIRRPYIVQLADKPVASYDGSIDGLPATQPQAGNRLDIDASEVHLYSDYLGQKQAAVRATVAAAPVTYNYSVVLNGFAAMLTDDEVRALQARSDVAQVVPDTPRQMVTTYTSSFLGLDKPDGLWTKLGGKSKAGENVIIGVVDGGVWPENPAYADRVDANGKPTFDNSGTLAYDAPPANWKGYCQAGEGFTVGNCNNKLIGAQYFDATYRSLPQYTTHWTEFRSPRDSIGGNVGHGGHGTHTSSTAGGNAGPNAIVSGIDLGPVTGMAPRARIAMYKVCWTFNDATDATGGKNSCFTGDSVAAIEKAVVDGVSVINFSISGGTSITDPVEQAFLHASNAGVFVSASAGNDGPANTVAHISPWQATVAASTHNRELQATVTLGNGRSFRGASMNSTAVGPAPMITAEAAALPGANPTLVAQCFSANENGGQAVLDPAKVAGKIVTCTRGGNARVDKSLAVQDAGGVGMVQIDNGTGLVAEVHAVPSVHVNAADGAVIKSYATTSGATASISTFVIGTSNVPAPTMASFSSRGPNRYDPNVLKPDMTAPGVDVIAGVSPNMTEAQRAALLTGTLEPVPLAWASYQGTSMSSPHVAGLAALLRQQHPTWSPAMIKSALMTTATDTFADAIANGDTRGRLPFGQGAGHVAPNAAANPGLVYDITELDYRKYMCGAGVAA